MHSTFDHAMFPGLSITWNCPCPGMSTFNANPFKMWNQPTTDAFNKHKAPHMAYIHLRVSAGWHRSTLRPWKIALWSCSDRLTTQSIIWRCTVMFSWLATPQLITLFYPSICQSVYHANHTAAPSTLLQRCHKWDLVIYASYTNGTWSYMPQLQMGFGHICLIYKWDFFIYASYTNGIWSYMPHIQMGFGHICLIYKWDLFIYASYTNGIWSYMPHIQMGFGHICLIYKWDLFIYASYTNGIWSYMPHIQMGFVHICLIYKWDLVIYASYTKQETTLNMEPIC